MKKTISLIIAIIMIVAVICTAIPTVTAAIDNSEASLYYAPVGTQVTDDEEFYLYTETFDDVYYCANAEVFGEGNYLIKLHKDITVTYQIIFTEKSNYIIDGKLENGNATITSTLSTNNWRFFGGGQYTLKNLNIIGSPTDGCLMQLGYDTALGKPYGDLDIIDCNIRSTGDCHYTIGHQASAPEAYESTINIIRTTITQDSDSTSLKSMIGTGNPGGLNHLNLNIVDSTLTSNSNIVWINKGSTADIDITNSTLEVKALTNPVYANKSVIGEGGSVAGIQINRIEGTRIVEGRFDGVTIDSDDSLIKVPSGLPAVKIAEGETKVVNNYTPGTPDPVVTSPWVEETLPSTTTPTPETTAPTQDTTTTPTESDTDVVAKISVNGGAETDITRGEFATKFKDEDYNNMTESGAFSGNGKNVLIKILMDIDVGTAQLGFYLGKGSTITIDGDPNNTGTNAKLTGSNTINPTIRVRSSGSGITDDTIGGTIIFQNFDYNKTASNFMQYYGYPKIEINDSHWTGVGSIQLSVTGGIINVNDGSVLESTGKLFADSWSGTDSKNVININAGATVKHSSNPSKNVVELTQANPNHTFNVNGGTVIGGITLADGSINFNSGTHTGLVTGNVTATVAPGFVLDDAGITTPPPYVPDGDNTPIINGNANDVVIEIYVGDTTDNPIQIKRSEVTTKLANRNTDNILCTDPSLLDVNVRVEVKYDIDIGENSISFFVNPGKTLTVNGNGHVILGYERSLYVMRANSIGSGGNVVFNELDIYAPRDNVCFGYYNNVTVDVNNCEWTSTDHIGIWAINPGADAVLNINQGSVIKAGGMAIYFTGSTAYTGSTININAGATVTCSGGKTIVIGDTYETAAIYLNIYGNVINTNTSGGYSINIRDTAVGTILTVEGGTIKGDLYIADYVMITLASGSIEGDLNFDTEDDEYVDIAGSFIINGEPWGYDETTTAPEDTTTVPTEETTEAPADTTTLPSAETTESPSAVTTTVTEVTTAEPTVMTTTAIEETTAEPIKETTAVPDEKTTPDALPETEAKTPTTSKETTAAPESSSGGCGGISVAVPLIALICAMSAVFIIKKK